MSRLIRIMVMCTVLTLSFGAGHADRPVPDVTFFDGTFADVDWSASVFTFNHPGATAGQATSGGNPGSHRAITTLQANLGESRVVIIEIRAGAVVDPAVLGGIAGIDYAEDQKCASGDGCAGLGQGWAPALRQGGKFYIVSPPSITTGVLPGWVSVSNVGLGAASFSEVVLTATSDTDPSSHPDFSALGGPVELGYARANRKNSLRTGRLDNWSVTVVGAAVPVKHTSWGELKTLYQWQRASLDAVTASCTGI